MDKEERKSWIAERRTYIGASDIPHICNVGEYSCARLLAYRKLGEKADFEIEETPAMRRGNRLESVAADYYKEKTGRDILKVKRVKHHEKPHLCVHMDRVVVDPIKGYGYLEIKTVNREVWHKIKKEGNKDEYIIQLQSGMAISGLTWGSFAIYWADGDGLIWFDADFDEKLGETLINRSDAFWLQNVHTKILPDQLPIGSKACGGCEFRWTCRGLNNQSAGSGDLIAKPELEDLAKEFYEAKEARKDAEEIEKTAKNKFIESVGNVAGKYASGKYVVPLKIVESQRFDTTAFKKEQPELSSKYMKTSKFTTCSIELIGDNNESV